MNRNLIKKQAEICFHIASRIQEFGKMKIKERIKSILKDVEDIIELIEKRIRSKSSDIDHYILGSTSQ